MAKTKRVRLSFIPTHKNLLILQNMGILNKHGRVTGKINFNEFLNRCIDERIGIEHSRDNKELLEKLIQSEIVAVQRDQEKRNNETAKRLRDLAQKLHEVQSQKKVIDYEGQND